MQCTASELRAALLPLAVFIISLHALSRQLPINWEQGENEMAPMSLLKSVMLWALCYADKKKKKNQPAEALKDGFSFK